MTFSQILLFALAGALGSLARYGMTSAVGALLGSAFPWGVFVVNVLGCFLFGAVWAAAGLLHLISDSARLIILTGFMGAFTTFSTFIFDSQALLESGNWLALLLNAGGQLILGLLALRLGIRLVALLA
ncbi:CrcB family protein [uncultured Desulfovibrio sp.]|uniref:fluoride efflux transporter FluC n=1 Tax=uncultured Desulfovibrio sp. TaxID=167968 RepID=UPI001C3BAB37|nr:CrcB family protein [uncultured Desulfovibrio sp.]HIX39444.1 CrcB family protein [Candidatus Desulfovibrio intestinigallinarum]